MLVVWIRPTFWSVMPSLAPQSAHSRTGGNRTLDGTSGIRRSGCFAYRAASLASVRPEPPIVDETRLQLSPALIGGLAGGEIFRPLMPALLGNHDVPPTRGRLADLAAHKLAILLEKVKHVTTVSSCGRYRAAGSVAWILRSLSGSVLQRCLHVAATIPAMPLCPACGAFVDSASVFCPRCRTPLVSTKPNIRRPRT